MLHRADKCRKDKKGNLCLRGKYITAVYGEDTKLVQTAGA